MEPTVEVQSGVHVVGEPEQFLTPAASNAYKMPEPTYTIPFETAGDDCTTPPALAVQSGAHRFGAPEQFVVPAASNAYKLPSPEPI